MTVNDIKNKKFDKAAFGYKTEDVEKFIDDVIDLVDDIESQRDEANKKLVVLANKIEEYRNEEDSLRQALLGAQKLGDSILKEARNRAEILLRDATIKSENIVKNVKEDVKREEVILNKTKREVDAFRNRMLSLYGSHIELIKSIPEIEHDAQDAPEGNAEAATAHQPTAEEVKPEPSTVAPTVEEKAETNESVAAPDVDSIEEASKEEGFSISNGFKFSRFDEDDGKTGSKFGPLKFGEGYNLNDDKK